MVPLERTQDGAHLRSVEELVVARTVTPVSHPGEIEARPQRLLPEGLSVVVAHLEGAHAT
jgi:hypothetical protein